MEQRSSLQNRALHLYFTLLADELNAAGLDMRAVLKPQIDIPWTGDSVKEYLWRSIQKVQLQKESTKDLSTKDIDVVYETLNRHLGEKFGIHVEFPSNEATELYQQNPVPNRNGGLGGSSTPISEA